MAISGSLIMLTIKSQECAPPREQLAFIRLKQVIYNKVVQLLYERFRLRIRKCSRMRSTEYKNAAADEKTAGITIHAFKCVYKCQ